MFKTVPVNLTAVLFSILLLLPNSVQAHSKASKSAPENGTIVSTPVDKIEIGFTKKLRLLKFKLFTHDEGFDPSAKNMDVNELMPLDMRFDLSKKFRKTAVIALDVLANGNYIYHWSGVAKDGHKIEGHGYFSVEIDSPD